MKIGDRVIIQFCPERELNDRYGSLIKPLPKRHEFAMWEVLLFPTFKEPAMILPLNEFWLKLNSGHRQKTFEFGD